jgi:hypothetical protein
MGQQLASKIDQDFRKHVETSTPWTQLEQGRGLTPAETAELFATFAGGLLAGLKTIALTLEDPEPPESA